MANESDSTKNAIEVRGLTTRFGQHLVHDGSMGVAASQAAAWRKEDKSEAAKNQGAYRKVVARAQCLLRADVATDD